MLGLALTIPAGDILQATLAPLVRLSYLRGMENETSTLASAIIWSGAAISVLGLVGLFWCILKVSKAKRANLDDEAMRQVLKSALPLNLGALFLSTIGLMMVIVGVFLA